MKEYAIINVSRDVCKEIYDTLIELHYEGLEKSNLEHEVRGHRIVEPNCICLNITEKSYEWLSDNCVIDKSDYPGVIKRYKSWKHFAPLIKGRYEI